MVQSIPFSRPAHSGEGEISSLMWKTTTPHSILQIAHGMAEHADRYDHFASYLSRRGYLVCMNNHAGHGPNAQTLGYFAAKDGWRHVMEDMKALMDEVAEKHPRLPQFLLGHSMGSFLARAYVAEYGEGLHGCILSGTAGKHPALPFVKALAALQKTIKGAKSTGNLLHKITTGSYNDRIPNAASALAWLSSAEDVVNAYMDDEYCGFPFTAGGYYDLFSLLQYINTPQWYSDVPKKLPMLLFSGNEDPVGDYGEGPLAVYAGLREAGCENISLKLYPGGRHEMLNEINREEVYEDIESWLNAHRA